jgi:hypothetical protein
VGQGCVLLCVCVRQQCWVYTVCGGYSLVSETAAQCPSGCICTNWPQVLAVQGTLALVIEESSAIGY